MPDSSAIAQLWPHVLENWENPAAHEALLQQCTTAGQLAEVAKLYRSQGGNPERTATADQQLKRITALALSQLDVQRREAPDPPPYGKYLAIALFLLGSIWLLTLL